MQEVFETLGIGDRNPGTSTGESFFGDPGLAAVASHTPTDGTRIGEVALTRREEYDLVMDRALRAFDVWRMTPAPRRGEIVRQIGSELREFKAPLGRLVSFEMGKILQEGLGEVQEMIDIADFAVGQSRMLYGKTMHSERPHHRMYEQWHPLGPVGVISAFNFPVAVYAWNAMIAAVCGDVVVWKGSEKTPLCSLAVQRIISRVLARHDLPEGIFNLVTGDRQVGEWMAKDERIPLISATGSIPMGRSVAHCVASRLGRTILELGGNNAMVVTEKADLEMTARAAVFGAIGTAGQRCTTIRRLLVQEDVFEEVRDRLLGAYAGLRIGDPLDERTVMGPLIDAEAVEQMQAALLRIKEEGGEVISGGEVLDELGGHFVRPALAVAENEFEIVQEETFAPILYLIPFRTLEEGIAKQNGVRQGLSSAIFSRDVGEIEAFLSHRGSDCGIANVNIGTSGAEIGGAFGGEKETGGGREAGSDAWKAYMRRQTNTINWGEELPLAQGIDFGV